MACESYYNNATGPIDTTSRTLMSYETFRLTMNQYVQLGLFDCETVKPFAVTTANSFAVVQNGTAIPQPTLASFNIGAFAGGATFAVFNLNVNGVPQGYVEVGYDAFGVPFFRDFLTWAGGWPILLDDPFAPGKQGNLNWTAGSFSGTPIPNPPIYNVTYIDSFSNIDLWVPCAVPLCYIAPSISKLTGFGIIVIPLSSEDNALGVKIPPLQSRVDLVNHAKSQNMFSFLK